MMDQIYPFGVVSTPMRRCSVNYKLVSMLNKDIGR